MYKKLDETISDTFVKPEKGLYTELFVIENLGLGKKAGNYLKEKYSPKERFKMMRKEYNLAQNNIVKPLALEELNGQKNLCSRKDRRRHAYEFSLQNKRKYQTFLQYKAAT
jgi:hypothetical protein